MNTELTELSLIQLNDCHAYLNSHPELFWEEGGVIRHEECGGLSRILTIVEQERKLNKNCLFLDNGDTLHGTFPVIQSKGELIVPILNKLTLEAMTMHWEFFYGPERTKELTNQLNYPALACNIYDQKTNQLIYEPYLIKNYPGVSVGIIGLASNIVDKTMPASFSEGIYFTSGEKELPVLIKELRSKKVDLILLISHVGFPQEMQLIKENPDLDICFSGHTHHRLQKPVISGKTIVIQSGCHGSFLGRLRLKIKNGKIISHEHKLIKVSAEIMPDQELQAMIDSALEPFSELDQIVGQTKTDLNRNEMLSTTMDDFMLKAATDATGIAIAFSNGWRYGAPIPAGPITMGALTNIVPMNPPVSKVTLSGQEIWDMLEENLERTFSADPFAQMGGYLKRARGITVTFKIENPKDTRIQEIFVGSEPIELDRSYEAAFVTDQGVGPEYGTNRQQTEVRVFDAMLDLLAKGPYDGLEQPETFILI